MNQSDARLELAIPPAGNLPHFVRERAPGRLEKLLTHPLRFTEIHGSDKLPPSERRRMTPRRVEAREGVIRVGKAFFKHMDVPSRLVGKPRSDGTFTGIGHEDHMTCCGRAPADCTCRTKGEQIAGFISITGLSPTRLRRYIALGKRGGYWTAHQHRERYWSDEKNDWAYSACRTVYRIEMPLINRLGLAKRLEKDAQKIYKKRCSRPRRIYPEPVMRGAAARKRVQPGTPRGVALELGGMTREAVAGEIARQREADAATGASPPAAAAPNGGTRRRRWRENPERERAVQLERLENFERNLVQLKLRLREKHPDWGADRIDRTARDILQRL